MVRECRSVSIGTLSKCIVVGWQMLVRESGVASRSIGRGTVRLASLLCGRRRRHGDMYCLDL